MTKTAESEDKVLSEQEMVGWLTQCFPDAQLSNLGPVGLKEAIRVSRALNNMGILLDVDFALIANYSLAFQRWLEAGEEVKHLTSPFVTGSNGFVQTHPAVVNEQKFFSILRASTRHLLAELSERTDKGDDDDEEDDLEKLLSKQTKDG